MADRSGSCDDVHMFLARGNNEAYPGRQAALVEATCDGLASCGYENLGEYSTVSDLVDRADPSTSIQRIVHGSLVPNDLRWRGGWKRPDGCVRRFVPSLQAHHGRLFAGRADHDRHLGRWRRVLLQWMLPA